LGCSELARSSEKISEEIGVLCFLGDTEPRTGRELGEAPCAVRAWGCEWDACDACAGYAAGAALLKLRCVSEEAERERDEEREGGEVSAWGRRVEEEEREEDEGGEESACGRREGVEEEER
jgi:hypothetical protein